MADYLMLLDVYEGTSRKLAEEFEASGCLDRMNVISSYSKNQKVLEVIEIIHNSYFG
jgi:hypothetical protein